MDAGRPAGSGLPPQSAPADEPLPDQAAAGERLPERGTIGVLGLGLIGGSLARDLAAAGHHVLGYDTDPAAVAGALRARVIASELDDSLSGLAGADIVILAAPVDAVPALLERASPHVRSARLVTDVGSTKLVVQDAAVRLGLADRFVGAHPLAGEQRSGWAVARAGLFDGARVYVCPAPGSGAEALDLARRLWLSVGARPSLLDAREHDLLLAWTSHLPQAVATALANVYQQHGIRIDDLGSGGRGMVRLAGSSPAMWTAIAAANRQPLRASLERLCGALSRLASALESDRPDAVREIFAKGRQWTELRRAAEPVPPRRAAGTETASTAPPVGAGDPVATGSDADPGSPESGRIASRGEGGAATGSDAATRVAFQGEPGAFSEEAALRFFGAGVKAVGRGRFADVARAVAEGDVAWGVLPVENTIAGSVADTFDQLLEHDLTIVGETVIPVQHCLLGLPGSGIEEIRRVISHPVALAQCTRFLAGHPGIEAVARPDTAGSARELAAAGTPEVAAIASRRAAELYGLVVLAADIQDRGDNQTRFVVVTIPDRARELAAAAARRPGPRKTTLVLETPNVPGALLRALQPFAARSINLARLESRPTGEPWTYRFFMEVEAGVEEPGMAAALDEAAAAGSVRILGSYPPGARS